ncbi:MAG: polysaccharide deacetylase family protein [Dethiobacteria bacterium]|jgi:polysaccharide deacetylase family sporulation protein PdaB
MRKLRGLFFIGKKKLKKIIWIAIPALAVLAWLFFTQNLTIPLTGGQARLVPIYYVDTTAKKVAISFDACWGASYTPEILKVLKEHNLKTTFFLTGFWVEKYPEMVQKIAEEGHEIGNHTFTHPHLNSLAAEEIKEELNKVGKMIFELTKKRPDLFRPPFGEYNNNVLTTAEKAGYRTIQWSIDSLDWQELGKEPMVKRVTENLHPGAIVLFHNNGLYTVEALPEIISNIKEQGYEILPISELLYQDNYYIDSNTGAQIQKPGRE